MRWLRLGALAAVAWTITVLLLVPQSERHRVKRLGAPTKAPAATFAPAALQVDRLPLLSPTFVPPPASSGPPPTLAAVAFRNLDQGVGVTLDGAIDVSADGGRSWRPVFHRAGLRLRQIAFVDGVHGFAVAASGCALNCSGPPVLLRTADGGRSWQLLTPSLPDGLAGELGVEWTWLRFTWPSAEVGYATLDPDMWAGPPLLQHALLRTLDGGRSWQAVPLPSGVSASGGVAFLSPKVGFVTARTATGSAVLATTDGGTTWRTVLTTAAPLYAVQFVNGRVGFAAGGVQAKWTPQGPRQILYGTADGGRTWRVVYQSQASGTEFAGLHFVTPDVGWATTGVCTMGANVPCAGPLLFTADGGRTWTATTSYPVVHPSVVGRAAWFVESGALPAEPPSLLFRTTDGGRHWDNPRESASFVVEGLAFPSATNGYLETNVGLFETTDGGRHWRPVPLPADVPPSDPFVFLGHGVLLDLGQERPLRSADDGRTWAAVRIPGLPAGVAAPESVVTLADGTALFALVTSYSGHGKGATPLSSLFVGTRRGEDWRAWPEPKLRPGALVVVGSAGNGTVVTGNVVNRVDRQGHLPGAIAFPKDLLINSDSFGPQGLWLTGTASTGLESLPVLLHSADGGRSFTGFRLPGGGAIQVVFTSRADGWLLLTTGHPGDLFRTTDGGRHWTEVWPDVAAAP